MKKTICNICGAECPDITKTFHVSELVMNGQYAGKMFDLDLCPNCRDTLADFLDQKCKHSPFSEPMLCPNVTVIE